ncbi:BREX-1 system adenine-specific DNA-methyltransferase PglX [Dolosigranulum savutiense]|uniref:site-specific DNA-methyltransferase (adenine-specific) n=1 Tax=Dolosigranulum savutiense TaxID=3110288 RepID=A0AB74U1M0_9LACT
MNKKAIKNFAVWARQKLMSDIRYKAGLLGISDKGIAEALPQSTNDLKFFDIGTKDYVEVSGKKIEQRKALESAIKAKEKDTNDYKEAYNFIIEEVAYTWFNRLIAIRFMEVNNYLPSGIRVLSSENKEKNEPDFVTDPFEADFELSAYEQDKVIELKERNKSDELFRMLFIKQCNKLHDILPDLFEETDDYTELLLTISFTDNDGVVYHLTHDIPEDDFNVEKEGQIEIIGWMYQYYNIEPKETVSTKKRKAKIKKEQVPAATQLFTPKWIVRYMVENSLGRLWHEGHNDSTIKDNWKYYIDEAKQEPEIQKTINVIREEYKTIKPEDIKLIDPCMGSGHILVYAFDIFMQIYKSYGYTQRDAASLIVENNIYGLDVDERAGQLAYFAVMMKGRQYDRRFFTKNITPHIYDIPEIEKVHPTIINAFGDCADIARRVCDSFIEGKEFGSLIAPAISLEEIEKLNNKLNEMSSRTIDIFTGIAINTVKPIMDIVKMLVQKYEVVVTNPPYMTVSNTGAKLNNYVKKYYPDSKADMFAVFMERCKEMLAQNGYQAMITMHSWMFLSSFEKLREKFLFGNIINMAHLGARAFEEISGEVVQTTSFVFRKSSEKGYKGTYCRLIEPNSQQGKETMFLRKENRFKNNQNNFKKIPGTPFAYWVSETLRENFSNKLLYDYSISPSQNITGNNKKYVRKFWEIDKEKIGGKDSWIFYCKGGGYRKWWGNLENIVNWTPKARNVYQHGDGSHASQIIKKDYWYKKGITWGLITSGLPSFRIMPTGATYDKGGSTIIVDEDVYNFTLALLNSKICVMIATILNPTLNFQVRDVRSMPLVLENIDTINLLTCSNVGISKKDWDSFETSWDFTAHPLVKYNVTSIKEAYDIWEKECEERFIILKSNEEELNRIFIDVYGLQEELTPEVEDKEVTVRKANLQRDIKSLISYAVGCMFGRYSLGLDGLIFAGGKWDNSKYSKYIPDADNCIPITDEEYFEDDIVGKLCDFIKVVFGEDLLEKNLKYIADTLGNKGTTSREVIRNYFLNDFIKDHIKTYQKRPIYWMFDSGKQNGFKALVYMHRWNADTTGNMRVEYLHRMQRVYEKEIERMQEIIDNSYGNKEVNITTKRKEKLQKQLKETKDYDAKVAHLALSRIDIDLDDGVKANYKKVQTSNEGKVMKVLTKL